MKAIMVKFRRAAQRVRRRMTCDQDDVWDPHKFEWAAAAIAKGPADLKLLVHNAVVTDERLAPGKLLYDGPAEETVTGRLKLPPEWYCWGFTQVFRSSLLREIPSAARVSFPWHKHRNPHDVWVALLANCTGSIAQTNGSLALYRPDRQLILASELLASKQRPYVSPARVYCRTVSEVAHAPRPSTPTSLLVNDSANRIDRFRDSFEARS